MTQCLAWLSGAAALGAMLSLPATAQEYSNGGNGAAGRGPAVLTPVEAFGVHPPGVDPADARRWCSRWRQRFIPYYAPLSPVASTARWRPWGYFPLLPYYTSYYPGYCPHRLFNPPPRRYGSNGWGPGPAPDFPLPEEAGTTPLSYAGYTSVIEDDTTYWNMGGNGLVPYGVPPSAASGPPDLIDSVEASRPRARLRGHFQRVVVEDAGEQEPRDNRSHRRPKPAEPIPPGKASRDQEVDRRPAR